MRSYARHVPLDRDGYDPYGTYWGNGASLFYVSLSWFDDDETEWCEDALHVRATNRRHAYDIAVSFVQKGITVAPLYAPNR